MKQIFELERFFELDLRVKKLIESSRPNTYMANPINIEEELLKTVDLSRSSLNQMVFLSGLDLEEEFNELLDKINEDIKKCNYNIDKLISIYEQDILSLSDNLEESLEKNIYGYGINNGLYVPLKYCKTINDMLHYVHFYVINNENILKSMNLIEEKNSGENNQVYRLYGKENKIAKDIFNILPEEETAIDEVSFDGHIIIMVRGRGHALTIDIQEEQNNDYRISYFIPKVCNIEQINKLKGVKKLNLEINDQNAPTHGEFVVKKEQLPNEINSFIKSVPTDENIIDKFGNKELNSSIKI